jgi:hypothetical protein
MTDVQVVPRHVRRQRVNQAAATEAAALSAARRRALRLVLMLEKIPIDIWDEETRAAAARLGDAARNGWQHDGT